MKPILYSIGDSVVWGAELENKEIERFSNIVSQKLNMLDCNNASAGVSNDYIFRNTIRDVSYWLDTKKCWSEESGWINSDEIFVYVGWTAPTRFEWWKDGEYQQERFWTGYDKWGDNDKDRTTEDKFVLNQTEIIPSYIKTLNQILTLKSFLETNKIPYYFSNIFYEYNLGIKLDTKIDRYGRTENQLCLKSIWNQLPESFTEKTLYSYVKENGGGFLQRNHPNLKSHKIISELITNKIKSWQEN